MSGCDIIPLASKACTGKCKGGGCSNAEPRIWVLAACGGMIALLEKKPDGGLMPLPGGDAAVFSSLDQFQQSIEAAKEAGAFNQLVIVGSKSDTAWVYASLPQVATPHISAEIEYPLLLAWFKQPMPLTQLTQALGNVFRA